MKDQKIEDSKHGSWQAMRAGLYQAAFQAIDRISLWCFSRKDEHPIASGLFQGMMYGNEHVGSLLSPKLLGTYEMELHQKILEMPTFDIAMDIGAAEGWYACGLLYIQKAKRMVAFETTAEGRAALRRNAEKNNLQARIEIHGQCTKEIFRQTILGIQKKTNSLLVVSDCEGYEKALFAKDTIADLKNATLLIETHDAFVPGVHKTLQNLLQETHTLNEVFPKPRKNPSVVLS